MSGSAVSDHADRRRTSGPAASPAAPGSIAGPGGNGSDRLPGPVRERRPALAALAVLLIVGGALASGLIYLRSGERSDYIVMRRTVDPGQQITASDFGVAQIAGSGARAIPAAERPRFIGQYSTTRLYAGTLATRAMFTPTAAVPAGSAVIGVVLSAQQRPAASPRSGDVVDVYQVPTANGAGTQATEITKATIVSVGAVSGSNGLPISLLVPQADVPTVTSAAALNGLAIVSLPAGTPVPGASPG